MKLSISKAMVTHLAWTEAFQIAIEEKRITDEVGFSGCDDLCPFGKWLYGEWHLHKRHDVEVTGVSP